ncbi:MAG: hypothetical protein PVH41_16060 [Anaerolineae bacterium]|jgi:hypothetical protein
MGTRPRLVLDQKEQALRDLDPEACLRHAIRRGALSLDEVTASLPPRIAAALRSVAAGERPPSYSPIAARTDPAGESATGGPRPAEQLEELAATRRMLGSHPYLTHLLDEQVLQPGEAMDVAHVIDDLLGRYMTGTRYAAP